MHLELAIPALVPAREALQAAHDSARLASLELLVARGRIARSARQSFEHWLAQAFGLDPGVIDDGLGLRGGVAQLALIFGERSLRVLAQLLGLVELGLDPRRAPADLVLKWIPCS